MSDLAKRLFNKSNYVLDLPLVRKCDEHESTSISSLLRQASNKINQLEARNKELENFIGEVMGKTGDPMGVYDSDKEYLYETALKLSKEAISNE